MVEAQSNLEDVFSMIRTAHRNREPFFHTAVYIELIARTEQEFSERRPPPGHPNGSTSEAPAKTDPNGFYVGYDKYGSSIIVDLERRAADKYKVIQVGEGGIIGGAPQRKIGA